MVSNLRIATIILLAVSCLPVLGQKNANGREQADETKAAERAVEVLSDKIQPVNQEKPDVGYRAYRFGMSVESVAKLGQVTKANARTVYTVPDLIQTLEWNAYLSPASATDPVRTIRFDFFKDQLFKIVAIYDRRRIEGLTTDDLTEAISAEYGAAARPEDMLVVTTYSTYEDPQKVIARWETGGGIYLLFRSSYAGEFGFVSYSKILEGLAAASILEAKRLEALAAPQREMDRVQREADELRGREEKLRTTNKPNFRP